MKVVDDFEPCRDEECTEERLHAKHSDVATCPDCRKPVIKLNRSLSTCSECSWRSAPVAARRRRQPNRKHNLNA